MLQRQLASFKIIPTTDSYNASTRTGSSGRSFFGFRTVRADPRRSPTTCRPGPGLGVVGGAFAGAVDTGTGGGNAIANALTGAVCNVTGIRVVLGAG